MMALVTFMYLSQCDLYMLRLCVFHSVFNRILERTKNKIKII